MNDARYIAVEGGEASGKSTQAARLADSLDAVLTREPGGTRIGTLVRSIVLDPANAELADRTEALLYAADRAQHAAEVVAPALAAGRHVVSDRSAWSGLVYQGYGRQMVVGDVRTISDWAIDGRWPDLVVLLDVPPPVAATRRQRALDRIEGAGDDFHVRVRDGFLALAADDSKVWAVVDGTGHPDDVALAVRAAVRDRLGL